MNEPKNIDEYNKRSQLSHRVTGFGLDTTVHTACPFCAAPDWMHHKIMDTETAMARGATCAECGRSARAIISHSNGGVSFEIVQTGGRDQPEWLEPKMRRL
jgi:bacterioferritin-associated ferredoxin